MIQFEDWRTPARSTSSSSSAPRSPAACPVCTRRRRPRDDSSCSGTRVRGDGTVGTTTGIRRSTRKFAAERAQPFWDLVALIRVADSARSGARRSRVRHRRADRRAAEQLDIVEMVGVDSSPSDAGRGPRPARRDDERALRRATSRSGPATATTTSCSPTPACSGCPTTPACSPGGGRRWRPAGSWPCRCRPTPTTRRTASPREVAATEPFLSAFDGTPPPDPVAANVLAPEQYAIAARRARRRRAARAAAGVPARPRRRRRRRRVGRRARR